MLGDGTTCGRNIRLRLKAASAADLKALARPRRAVASGGVGRSSGSSAPSCLPANIRYSHQVKPQQGKPAWDRALVTHRLRTASRGRGPRAVLVHFERARFELLKSRPPVRAIARARHELHQPRTEARPRERPDGSGGAPRRTWRPDGRLRRADQVVRSAVARHGRLTADTSLPPRQRITNSCFSTLSDLVTTFEAHAMAPNLAHLPGGP